MPYFSRDVRSATAIRLRTSEAGWKGRIHNATGNAGVGWDELRGHPADQTPKGNELKAPFGEVVVTGRRQMAARADCGRTLARSHGHFDTLLVGTEVGVLVDKTSETMAPV